MNMQSKFPSGTRLFSFLSVICIAGLSGNSAHAQSTTVYYNADVFTAAKDGAAANAFAVKDGRFIAVGDKDAVIKAAGPDATRVDLHARFVMPGLGDAHWHGEGGGSHVALDKVRSMDELIAALRAGAASAPADSIVMANPDWHEAQLAEHRKPTTADLDRASSTVPIIVPRGGHSLFLNSAALRKFGISAATPVPPGGSIERNPDGSLTGEIVDAAKSYAKLPPPPPLTEAAMIAAQQRMNSYGVTSVRVPGGLLGSGTIPTFLPIARDMQRRNALNLRYTLLYPGPGTGRGSLEALKSGPQQGEGDEWVRIDGVKLMVDGGYEGSHFTLPYAEPAGKQGTYFGLETLSPEETLRDVVALRKAGWNVAVHVGGDAALDQVLDAFEAAKREVPSDFRSLVIEHALVSRPDQVKRLKALDIPLSVQDHLFLGTPSMVTLWGKDRAVKVSPLKQYHDAGLLLVGGTDSPVNPPNPFWSIYHYISRDTLNSGVMGSDEILSSRADVLRMFTINFAKLVGAETARGSIETGKLADFVVLSSNLLTAPAENVRDAQALATFVDGREVYRSAAFADR